MILGVCFLLCTTRRYHFFSVKHTARLAETICQNNTNERGEIVKHTDDMTQEEKLKLLHQWQAHYNMIPRTDSMLTAQYLNGVCTWPVDTIARELMATEYLYKYTLYGDILEDFMRQVSVHIREKYHISWKATWKIVRFYAPIAMKLIALLQTGTSIPERLPVSLEETSV